METIEQLRSDPRPLVSLANVSAVTGEPIGALLKKLLDQGAPLLFQPPRDARIYCVTRGDGGAYQQSILVSPTAMHSAHQRSLSGGFASFEAPHLGYLIVSASDCLDLLDSDADLPVRLFNQAAFLEGDAPRLTVVTAAQYFKECAPKAKFHQSIKSKFGCYTQEGPERENLPNIFQLTTMKIVPEKLLTIRADLLRPINTEQSPNNQPSPKPIEHLQPWKSEFLKAMNMAAYRLYASFESGTLANSNITPTEVTKALTNELTTGHSRSKITTAATLLRHEHRQLAAREYLEDRDISHYPIYFSQKLIYLNEKCREYHDDYLIEKKPNPHSATSIERELNNEGVVPKNTATRIAGEIKPIYEKIKNTGQ